MDDDIGVYHCPMPEILIGAGGMPLVIGDAAEFSSFSLGIVIAETFMLCGPPFVFLLRLGNFEAAPGC